VLEGKRATEIALKSQPLDQFRILHFALHGFSDTNIPERTALLLAADNDSAEDGLLQDREIRDLRLAADLVTLSACDTGIGRLQGQEGISSLLRSFLLAGARSVVASLWQVDDRSTGVLMKHFYSYLSKGEDKSNALRLAKLDLFGNTNKTPCLTSGPASPCMEKAYRVLEAKPLIERSQWRNSLVLREAARSREEGKGGILPTRLTLISSTQSSVGELLGLPKSNGFPPKIVLADPSNAPVPGSYQRCLKRPGIPSRLISQAAAALGKIAAAQGIIKHTTVRTNAVARRGRCRRTGTNR
jgi:hypothetical protein